MVVEDIRPDLGSNLKKIWGSKVLVPLESPGYADKNTGSLILRLLGKEFCGVSKRGGPYRKSIWTHPLKIDVKMGLG